MKEFFLIGRGTDTSGIPVFIALTYPNPNEPRIFVQLDRGPGAENWDLAANKALQHAPRTVQFENVDSATRFAGIVTEPPGWFERKCAEANCKWFIPLVKRMAAGDNVPFREIEEAYQSHNGKSLPCGAFKQIIT